MRPCVPRLLCAAVPLWCRSLPSAAGGAVSCRRRCLAAVGGDREAARAARRSPGRCGRAIPTSTPTSRIGWPPGCRRTTASTLKAGQRPGERPRVGSHDREGGRQGRERDRHGVDQRRDVLPAPADRRAVRAVHRPAAERPLHRLRESLRQVRLPAGGEGVRVPVGQRAARDHLRLAARAGSAADREALARLGPDAPRALHVRQLLHRDDAPEVVAHRHRGEARGRWPGPSTRNDTTSAFEGALELPRRAQAPSLEGGRDLSRRRWPSSTSSSPAARWTSP